MPLELVMPLIEQWTGRVVLRPQALPQSNISLVAKQPMTKAEAMRALETLLNLNGIALVRMGDKFIKVVALQNARGESPQMIEGSSLDLPPSGQVVSKLFQLQFLRTAEIGQMLGGLSLGNISQPVVFEKSNSVLITDTLNNIQRIEMLLQRLDQPMTANLTPKFYNIHFAKASELVNKIRSMLQQQPQIGTSANYTPDDRTNQVILLSDPRLHPFFDELITKLDVKSDPNTRNEVLYLKHAAAKEVAPILNQLVSGQTKAAQNTGSVQPGMITQPGQPPPPPTPNQPAAPVVNTALAGAIGDVGSTQFSSLVNIIAEERSNAIVVNGTMDDIRLIKELVDKIDIVLAQVRIEVVIAEVTLADAASTGIDSLGLDVAGNKLIGFTGSVPGLTVGASANSSPYANLHGTLLTDKFAAAAGNMSLVGLVSLTSTPRKNNSRILSVPAITTTHNKKAKLFFGETRPVISGTTSGVGNSTSSDFARSSTVQQQEIGTTITVTPLIGNDGSVQLDITQVISEVTGTTTIDNNPQYIIGKREMNSFNTVQSNEIIVLGGMQKTNKTRESKRLGPIPWIGDLLGFRSRNLVRTELVVFIRPYVLTNTAADNEAALKVIDKMPDAGEIRQKLDPKYVPPPTPFYKKHIDIP
ncbi:MAG: secretin N-terminal domain-containing protein [Nibricoccus sp.]